MKMASSLWDGIDRDWKKWTLSIRNSCCYLSETSVLSVSSNPNGFRYFWGAAASIRFQSKTARFQIEKGLDPIIGLNNSTVPKPTGFFCYYLSFLKKRRTERVLVDVCTFPNKSANKQRNKNWFQNYRRLPFKKEQAMAGSTFQLSFYWFDCWRKRISKKEFGIWKEYCASCVGNRGMRSDR